MIRTMRPNRRATRAAGLLACCLTLCAVAAPSAHADAELTVSPLIMELEAEAGDVLTETITATASGDEPITVELVHADFGFSGAEYGIVLIRDDAPETTAFSTRDWFSLPQERYRIPAGSSRDLPLRIEVPKNTPGGTYLGAALLRVVPPAITGGGSQVQAVPETGPLLFIAVEGGEPPKAAMKRFDVPGLLTKGPINPKLAIENRGDEFFTFEGTVVLSGPGKDETIKVGRQFVVPGEPRTIRTSADEKGKAGALGLGSKNLKMGRYEVTARLRVEPVGTTLVATRTVWIVPMWVRIAAAVTLLVLLACTLYLARWMSHRRKLRRLEHEGLAAAAADRPVHAVDADTNEESEDTDDIDEDLTDEDSWDADDAEDADDAKDDELEDEDEPSEDDDR